MASREAAERRLTWPGPTLGTPLNDLDRHWGCMAKRNYLVEGLSGAGKSSVYEELIRRGYKAVSTDRAWAYHADPNTGLLGGPVRHDTFMWTSKKLSANSK